MKVQFRGACFRLSGSSLPGLVGFSTSSVDDEGMKIRLRKQKEILKVSQMYVTRGTFSDLRVN